MSQPLYVTGLDLGQANDPSALAVAEVTEKGGKHVYTFRHLHRWHLGTGYPQIVEHVRGLFARPPLAGSALWVDATGVGRAVVDLFRSGGIDARLQAVTITGGNVATRVKGGFNVPKKDLVAALLAVMGTRRIVVANALPLAQTLRKELLQFRVKVRADTGHETYEALCEADHDDLVLACALTVWSVERSVPAGTVRAYSVNGRKQRQVRIAVCSLDELDTQVNVGRHKLRTKHPAGWRYGG